MFHTFCVTLDKIIINKPEFSHCVLPIEGRRQLQRCRPVLLVPQFQFPPEDSEKQEQEDVQFLNHNSV